MLSIDPSFLIWRSWSRKSSSEKPSPRRAFLASSSDFLRSRVDSAFLDEGKHVAHAEDAADDAVGMERLEGVGLFAYADELDGLAGDVADGERRAAAGIAVHFGEDDAGEREAGMKILRGVDGVLAGHGVGDEEDLLRAEKLFEALHLGHQVWSMWRRPAVSTMSVSQPMMTASRRASLARRSTSAEPAGSPFWSPS
jgi:hypothetical protein